MSTAFQGLSHTDANTAWLFFASLEGLYIMQIPFYKANQGAGNYLVGKEGNAALIKSGVLKGWTYRKLAVQTVFNYLVACGFGLLAGDDNGVLPKALRASKAKKAGQFHSSDLQPDAR